MCCRSAGAPGPVTVSSVPKTCRFETAATEIAAGALPGEPTEPRPKSSRSFPAEITGTTPAAATLLSASISASLAGSISGPPPEKLITSMPSFTAASKAAHDLRRVGVVADRRRHVEDAVVADPRVRRDPGEAADRRMVGAGRDDVPATPAAIPGDVRAVERRLAVERQRPRRPEPGPGRRARRSPSASSTSVPPFGKPAGYEKPAGLKNGFVWSTPSSTTPIFIPSPRRRSSPRTCRRGSRDGLLFVSRW